MHRVVIIGAGFGGLNAAKGLRRAPVEITVVDRTNHHLFQPLLYQVATGGLSPADIATPIRHILRRQRNATVIMDRVTDIELGNRRVIGEHSVHDYDFCVVATGAKHHYFGHDEWARWAPGLKTLDDAIAIRRRVLEVFEQAERGDIDEIVFVVIGGGPTGMEMAGTIAETARDTLRHEFRHIQPQAARVLLVEAGDRVLSSYPADLSDAAQRQAERLGVEVLTGWMVTSIDAGELIISDGTDEKTLHASAVVWAAGVRASELASRLAKQGVPTDRAGRVVVEADLSLPGHGEVFVIGDAAAIDDVPGTAPAAIQMGAYVAGAIRDRIEGRTTPPFRYRDKGNLATIGRSAAVADFGRIRLTGWPAWVAWLIIHLYFLIGFENRLLVMLQWAWNYVTRNRSARLIR